MTPVDGMVAKIPVERRDLPVSLMTYGYDPELAMWSPFHNAVYALVHSIANPLHWAVIIKISAGNTGVFRKAGTGSGKDGVNPSLHC